ncbi:n-acetylglucosaminyl-phosphatidylinositol de-n-acetylase-related protein [Babesia gibsoni]|uniref:N-acetylglucosaminylphosphatidylinositol deacetylase n=1 Tax=Babesia gibsoni TaxID=33632 RepID=A0AAD8PFK1_BABGI|nr:n-acetylglucosaminyl-phosphatidylinositol de-n-acetylase-related protein [Babesia gibsoni]
MFATPLCMAFIAILVPFCWRANVAFDKEVDRILKEDPRKCVALVFAHPDDESMFLTPFLEYLQRKRPSVTGLDVKMLTLSSGNAEGVGELRKVELSKLCDKYAIDCKLIDDPLLQDGPMLWDTSIVVRYVRSFLDETACNFVVTFDDWGVSDHPNHKSVSRAVVALKAEKPNLLVWLLVSHIKLIKYVPLLGILSGLLRGRSVLIFGTFKVYANMKIHATQMRWHILPWSFLSSYAYANSFRKL